MQKPISIYNLEAMQQLRAECRIQPHRVKMLWTRFLKQSRGTVAALSELPPDARKLFSERVVFHSLELIERKDSQHDGATKLIFKNAHGFLIESVILRTATGRVSLCVSSQVGCAAACAFCATGQMGIAQNLTPAEILDQIVQASELVQKENRRIRNIVFMGMGEPFHNEANVFAAIDALRAAELFHHPDRYILVSTVGIPDAMLRFAKRYPRVNLALSLHSVNQEKRRAIIPLAVKHSLESLRTTLDEINRLQNRPVMIEYLTMRGVNDSLEEADKLVEFVRGLQVHINLIPYNAIAEAPQLVGSEKHVREAFANRMKAAGITTTIRYSLGSDIAAACGQLVRQENRNIARKNHLLLE